MKAKARFAIKEFCNRGGSTSWRVAGIDRHGRRLRLNFGSLQAARAKQIELEADFLDARTKVSATTRDNDRRAVSRFLGWCIERPRRWLLHNPCSVVSVATEEDTEPEILGVDECSRLLTAAREHKRENRAVLLDHAAPERGNKVSRKAKPPPRRNMPGDLTLRPSRSWRPLVLPVIASHLLRIRAGSVSLGHVIGIDFAGDFRARYGNFMRNSSTNLFQSFRVTTLAIVLSGAMAFASAGDLLPFRGTVRGEVSVELADGSVSVLSSPPAEQISSHLGRGRQIFDWVEFSQTDNGLSCLGWSRFVAANKDELRVGFELDGTFTQNGDLAYVGRFWVLPGGTGRFDFAPSLGQLGDGTLEGAALVVPGPEPGFCTLFFEHDFSGQIRSLRRAKLD